jgi:hypothetical protein
MAEALMQLDSDERGKYANTESTLEDIHITPVVIVPKDDSPYWQAKVADMSAEANEQAMVSALHRLNKARSKRLERITKKISKNSKSMRLL